MYRMRALAERKVQWHEALGFFMNVLCETTPTGILPEVLLNERALRKVQSPGTMTRPRSTLESASENAWGLLNAVTGSSSTTSDERVANRVPHGLGLVRPGAQIKQRALDAALQMVA